MDNKLREEKEAEKMQEGNDGEEKHLAEQKVKEKIEDKENELKILEKEEKGADVHEDLAKLDTQLKGILKTSDSKQNLKEVEVGVTIKLSENEVKKPEAKLSQTNAIKQDGAISKPTRALPQIEKFESATNKIGGNLNVGQKLNMKDVEEHIPEAVPSVDTVENAQSKTHSVKQLVRNFEKVARDKDVLEIPKAFSVPENMSEKDRNYTGVVPRRQSEPSCNIVENSFPEHLISRAQLTFAIMQTDDRTHTMGDDNVDENATRAAPFTQASQWQGVSGFASSTDNSENEEEGGEEVIGADGKVHKSTTKSKKTSFLHTLADEDDLKLDSIARNSMYFDGDKDHGKLMRNSLIFIDDDIEDSPQEQLNIFIKEKMDEKSLGLESKEFSYNIVSSDKSRGGKSERPSNEGSAIATSQISDYSSIPHAFTVPSQLSDKLSDNVSDKLTKDLGNRMSIPSKYPTSPSKSSLKDKESLSDVKKLAVLNNLKLSGFGKLSSSIRKERSSDSLDKIAKDKPVDSNITGSPSKSRHLLKPIDLLLKEKTKSDGDIAGSERRSRSRSREGRERGRSNSRTEEKTRRRQSLTTIDEHIRTRGATPAISPLEERVQNSDNIVPSSGSGIEQNNAIIYATDNKDNKMLEERKHSEEKGKKEKRSRRRSSSAPRVEKNENNKNAEPELLTPVPPLELNQKVPKPPGQGTAPKKNLVYSAR